MSFAKLSQLIESGSSLYENEKKAALDALKAPLSTHTNAKKVEAFAEELWRHDIRGTKEVEDIKENIPEFTRLGVVAKLVPVELCIDINSFGKTLSAASPVRNNLGKVLYRDGPLGLLEMVFELLEDKFHRVAFAANVTELWFRLGPKQRTEVKNGKVELYVTEGELGDGSDVGTRIKSLLSKVVKSTFQEDIATAKEEGLKPDNLGPGDKTVDESLPSDDKRMEMARKGVVLSKSGYDWSMFEYEIRKELERFEKEWLLNIKRLDAMFKEHGNNHMIRYEIDWEAFNKIKEKEARGYIASRIMYSLGEDIRNTVQDVLENGRRSIATRLLAANLNKVVVKPQDVDDKVTTEFFPSEKKIVVQLAVKKMWETIDKNKLYKQLGVLVIPPEMAEEVAKEIAPLSVANWPMGTGLKLLSKPDREDGRIKTIREWSDKLKEIGITVQLDCESFAVNIPQEESEQTVDYMMEQVLRYGVQLCGKYKPNTPEAVAMNTRLKVILFKMIPKEDVPEAEKNNTSMFTYNKLKKLVTISVFSNRGRSEESGRFVYEYLERL